MCSNSPSGVICTQGYNSRAATLSWQAMVTSLMKSSLFVLQIELSLKSGKWGEMITFKWVAARMNANFSTVGIQKRVEWYLQCARRNPKWPVNVWKVFNLTSNQRNGSGNHMRGHYTTTRLTKLLKYLAQLVLSSVELFPVGD